MFDLFAALIIVAVFAVDAVAANLANRRSIAERMERHARY